MCSTSCALALTQRVVAAYWVDANNTITPLGHMISITAILLRDHHAMLALASEAHARASIAVANAFVGCWKCKCKYTFC